MNYFDREGQPIGMEDWALLHALGKPYWRVAFTRVTDWLEVSTVWLGLDHRFSGSGPPLIFETMSFFALDEPNDVRYSMSDDVCIRSSTWTEALQVHASVVTDYLDTMGATAPVEHTETETP